MRTVCNTFTAFGHIQYCVIPSTDLMRLLIVRLRNKVIKRDSYFQKTDCHLEKPASDESSRDQNHFNLYINYLPTHPQTYKPCSSRFFFTMTTDIIGDRVQLQLHLKLLKAFSSLKEKVETVYTFGSLRSSELDHATKFKIFVNMAVYRFEHWLQAMTKSQVTGQLRLEHLPPLDVLMVWHAYSLNPR